MDPECMIYLQTCVHPLWCCPKLGIRHCPLANQASLWWGVRGSTHTHTHTSPPHQLRPSFVYKCVGRLPSTVLALSWAKAPTLRRIPTLPRMPLLFPCPTGEQKRAGDSFTVQLPPNKMLGRRGGWQPVVPMFIVYLLKEYFR